MELAASPSADLFALTDPAARGPAPLLRPGGAEPAAAAAGAPFDVFLALLAARLPAGEPLPATGKDLPLELAGVEADEVVTPIAALLAAPLVLTAAVELGARAGTVSPDGSLPAPMPIAASALAPTPMPLVAMPTTPGAEPAALSDVVPQQPPGVNVAESMTPLLEALPDQPEVAASPTTPSWLDELLTDAAQRSVPAAQAGAEQRAAAAQNASGASSLPAAAVPPPDVAPQFVKIIRDDAPRAPQVAPLIGDAPSAGRIDWLPSSSASAAAPNAPTTPTVAPPSAPVDVRTPNWHEAFAGRVQWLVDNQVGEARIKLNPPELGAIDVKISLVDDKSYVQLTTATAAARDELAQSLPRFRELSARQRAHARRRQRRRTVAPDHARARRSHGTRPRVANRRSVHGTSRGRRRNRDPRARARSAASTSSPEPALSGGSPSRGRGCANFPALPAPRRIR